MPRKPYRTGSKPEPATKNGEAVELKLHEPAVQEIGLHVNLKGRVQQEDGDYMHPHDLARHELFLAKVRDAKAKLVIVEKEEQSLRLRLKWQEQSLRIAKLEHDARLKELDELKEELKKDILSAEETFKALNEEVKEAYKLDDALVYDDVSGKLMPVD